MGLMKDFSMFISQASHDKAFQMNPGTGTDSGTATDPGIMLPINCNSRCTVPVHAIFKN
jgi:hypothetical protein